MKLSWLNALINARFENRGIGDMPNTAEMLRTLLNRRRGSSCEPKRTRCSALRIITELRSAKGKLKV